jgi:hypothetical protein
LQEQHAARAAPLNYEQPEAQEPEQKEGQCNHLHVKSPSAVSPARMASDRLTVAEGDTSAAEIVGGEFNRDRIPGQNFDVELAHFSGRVRLDHRLIL